MRLVVEWRRITIAGGLAAAALDAALLQKTRSFFTGGFLAGEHLDGALAAAGFFAACAAVDAAVVGVAAAIALAVVERRGWSRPARAFAAFTIGVAPLVVINVVSYQITRYLGDAFDLLLMFDLAGRRPSEFLAVGADHMAPAAAAAAGAALLIGGTAWLLNRTGGRRPAHRPARGGLATESACLLAAGLAALLGATRASAAFDDGLRRTAGAEVLGTLVEAASDIDRDGFGLMSRPGDPDPFDSGAYPYAIDVPGNGIDENGLGGDLPDGPARHVAPETRRWTARPNVVLVVLESVRADAVGAEVNGRPVTPVLDALAREGISVGQAFSHNGYTAQSRHHLFSGNLVNVPARGTLIDDFQANGYEVAYFSGQDESFGGPAMAVGFDRADVAYDARVEPHLRYSTFQTPGSLAVPYTVVTERIGEFLERRDRSRPLFLYVNYHDTHFPYDHGKVRRLISDVRLPKGAIAPERAADLRTMYLNTVANVDAAIGRVLDTAARTLGAPPAVIVVADHGESLFDEGFLGHGYALNDVQTRIPLIAARLPVEIREPFGQADLRDTIGAALSAPKGRAPRTVPGDGRFVFQYLGSLRRPRQIGFTTPAGRTIYDFRTGRVRHPSRAAWALPHHLSPSEHGDWVELVRFWERLVLEQSDDTGVPQQ
jgi:hypothetical protein